MAKTGRNDLCPCGSGKKYKKCHEAGDSSTRSRMLMIVVGGAVLAAIAIGLVSYNSDPATGDNVRVWDPAHGHYHNAAGVQVP